MKYHVSLSVLLHSLVFNAHLPSTSPIHSRSPVLFVAGRVWRRGRCLAVDPRCSMLLTLLCHTSLSRSPPLLVAGRVLKMVGCLSCEELHVAPARGTLGIRCERCGLPMGSSFSRLSFVCHPLSISLRSTFNLKRMFVASFYTTTNEKGDAIATARFR